MHLSNNANTTDTHSHYSINEITNSTYSYSVIKRGTKPVAQLKKKSADRLSPRTMPVKYKHTRSDGHKANSRIFSYKCCANFCDSSYDVTSEPSQPIT